MAFNSSTPEMNLKLLINKKDNKVVFAEAEKDFIDFLFNLLTLPIGTITGFLPKEICLGGLHESMKKLEEAYLQPNQSPDSPLKLNTPAYAILPFFNPSSSRSYGHVLGLVTYMVTDDLSITPMSLTETMALFKKYNIEEVGVLEEKVVAIGLDEALQILKGALQSKAALTKAFLEKEETKAKVNHRMDNHNQPLIIEPSSHQIDYQPSTIEPPSYQIDCRPSTIKPPSHQIYRQPLTLELPSHQVDCQPSTIKLPSHQIDCKPPKPATTLVTIQIKPMSHVGLYGKPRSSGEVFPLDV
ncbi:uncharacterized protein LOC104881149 isoform X2 [Vitis vinifera]|uniref:uncharacterized protein LOC104881149 isoform X2 n=1 Tax=Vitis vinifera TaxID=29760 RepID=UPI00053F618C|nr:uncharacterized protein LOC104881149 isoform X2 [Vitis vinifera]|eukprot:XP_010658634.1 PREDICTED: uncharacterized protein LOC104881149 isoform X2 [Vitis vinifera]